MGENKRVRGKQLGSGGTLYGMHDQVPVGRGGGRFTARELVSGDVVAEKLALP